MSKLEGLLDFLGQLAPAEAEAAAAEAERLRRGKTYEVRRLAGAQIVASASYDVAEEEPRARAEELRAALQVPRACMHAHACMQVT